MSDLQVIFISDANSMLKLKISQNDGARIINTRWHDYQGPTQLEWTYYLYYSVVCVLGTFLINFLNFHLEK